MNRGLPAFVLLAFVLITQSACQTGQMANYTYDQDMYSQCVGAWDQFINLEKSRALVCGTDSSSTVQAFWSAGQASDAVARANAMDQCKRRYQFCELFADSRGLTQWAQEISDNGGTSQDEEEARHDALIADRARQREEDAAALAIMNGMLQGAAQGLQTAPRSTGGSSFGSGGCGGPACVEGRH
jgi:hypothetical protein